MTSEIIMSIAALCAGNQKCLSQYLKCVETNKNIDLAEIRKNFDICKKTKVPNCFDNVGVTVGVTFSDEQYLTACVDEKKK